MNLTRNSSASANSRRRRKGQTAVEDQDFSGPKIKQAVNVIGQTVFCDKCQVEVASNFCPCDMFLCSFDLAAHSCIILNRATYSRELLDSLA